MDDDLRVFRELILWLWQTHEKPWKYSHEVAKLIAEDILNYDRTFNSIEELESHLPSDRLVCGGFGNRYLYLNPVFEGRLMVPRIQIKYDFGRNIPEIRCRLEMFLVDDDINVKSLGYRFESPEGKNNQNAGVHHYYHIQMIQPPTCRIDWLPETQPAFPLDADNPVKLLLCVLVSLYGLDYLGTIIREAHNIWKLGDYAAGVPHTKFGPFKWYRLVEVGDPVRHIEGYKITSNINDFEEHTRRRYTGCGLKGITKSAFDALHDAEKKNYP